MARSWDESFDLVIVGSGGGGLVAALTAVDGGLDPVVIEKQDVVGGSTAMSGGIVWVPNNPLMREDGIADSDEAALEYFASVVGDAGPASSLERRTAFLRNAQAAVELLRAKGVGLIRCAGYSDYYDTRRGGNVEGRTLEGIAWDAYQLGAWREKVNPGLARRLGLVVHMNEIRSVAMYLRSPKAFAVAARVFLRTQIAKRRGQDLFTMGMSLVGQMLKVALDEGVPVWLDTPFESLVLEDGKVVGIRVRRNGRTVSIEARRGVLLAAGGFEHNSEMRKEHSGAQPNDGRWSGGNAGNTGEVLSAAMALGGPTDFLDEAVWSPGVRGELMHASTLYMARNLPGTIFVDSRGRRFVNEANSYLEVVQAMYAADAIPCWLLFDDAYRRRYPQTVDGRPGRLPEEWIEQGWIRRADTLEDLATIIGVDRAGLADTVAYFNQNARKGLDPEFGRGASGYNSVLGDPGYRPNHAIGPLDQPPFYATEVYPYDVGTFGGVVADEFARVIGPDGTPIPGLYATGNLTATVMGRTYPGAGASIANSIAFGHAAARHAAHH